MKGNLSINSENILPVIKKWLYSDTDIFVRELVSNSCDAITKLKKLADMGQAGELPENEAYKINIELNKEEKVIKFIDNGIGMTGAEVQEYINQIAFSGATAFMEQYGDKLDKENEIIGHFGLGFYSAFMVSDKVEINTLSFKEDEKAVKWVSEGGSTFELTDGDKTSRGTEITLYINDSSKEYLEEYKLRGVIEKYCGFMPVGIYFDTLPKKEDEKQEEKEEGKEGSEENETPAEPINDPSPLWLKPANECTDEEYKEFYRKVFMDFNEPIFWMHLNMDYPFRLKGILYFPKLKHELESIEGQVKLYNNQVFIADNIKEVIPEFLLLLKGVMDCPDLPLNVSRSFLQNDSNVSKMSGYIIKKVADKLNSIFKNDRETYNNYWNDINPFIKYGCIRERSFYDKVKESLVFKTTESAYLTINEFTEKNKEKTGNKIYYVTNEQQQASYIKMFKDNGMEAAVLT
ncbi:MAG: molecular chaperone HtpG, partial [Clostridiales bacterium]|nr:molecular chaperone HtpG [Clostridiales bacterium]